MIQVGAYLLVLVPERFGQLAVPVAALKVRVQPVGLLRGKVVAQGADAHKFGRTQGVLSLEAAPLCRDAGPVEDGQRR